MSVLALKSLSQPLLFCLCVTLLWTTACNFSDNVDNDESGTLTPDMRASTQPDAGVVPDVGMITSQMDMVSSTESCTPLNDETLCAQRSLQCGDAEITDNCGRTRDIMCGECGESERCDTTTSLCECVPKTDAELCSALGLQCGPSRTLDNCGMPRVVDCGGCSESDVLCEANMCSGCAPETNEAFCARHNKNCGSINELDNCGVMRSDVACGVCKLPKTCSPDNVCACVPESDAQMCDRLGKNCGMLTANDNCGASRDIACGDCVSGQCLQDNTCSVCMPESDAAFCTRMGSVCGQLEGADNCGAPRAANCGSCAPGEVCQNSQCICPTPVCPGRASCGIVSSQCGASLDCGSCETGGEECVGNTCACPTPSCQNHQCGTILSICGSSVNCGSCTGTHDACLGNTCVCQGESNAQLCLSENAQCGNISVIDRCGVPRNVICGGCTSGQYCFDNSYCCQDGQICDFAVE